MATASSTGSSDVGKGSGWQLFAGVMIVMLRPLRMYLWSAMKKFASPIAAIP